jgi:hypothetical protein
MRILIQIVFGLALCAPRFAAHAAEPRFPSGAVFFPTFCFNRGSFSGGTAFVVRNETPAVDLIVTAHHLFGPACGLESDLGWDEMPKVIKLVVGVGADNPATHIVATRPLRIVGAHALDDSGLDRDIAAFELDRNAERPSLVLATNPPKKGDKVWLVGEDYGKGIAELHEASVVLSSASELRYAFKNTKIELRGTSGAPVIDAGGAVVAINIGGGRSKTELVGMGNPVTSIRKHLERALKASPLQK